MPNSEPHHSGIDTVLVPTDRSENSLQALQYAAALAEKLGAALHVMHVSEIDYAIPGTDSLASDSEIAHSLKEQLEVACGRSIAASFHGRTGRAFDQVCRFGREIAADLIVISTHGRTGLKRFFLGSNAERIVQHSSVPVLVVRGSEPVSGASREGIEIRTILVPTDFSGSSDEALKYAVQFGRQFDARLVLFHSFNNPEFVTTDPYGPHYRGPSAEEMRTDAEAQMQELVKRSEFGGLAHETHVCTGRAADEICEFAQRESVDLIITSTHGRTGFIHVLIGSIAEQIVRYAHAPVLVIPGSIKNAQA